MDSQSSLRRGISTRLALGVFVLVSFVLWLGVLMFSGTDMLAVEQRVQTTQVSPTTSPPTHTIVAFGDSITAGYGLSLNDAYPAVLERSLAQAGFSVRVVNAGVSGETTAGGLRRAAFIAGEKPDIVVLALGGNDVLRGIPPEETRANLFGIIQTLQEAGARVLLVGMRAPSNLGPVYQDEFDTLYRALANEFMVAFVPFLLDGVALDPALNQSDGIHPNEAGARVIAEKLLLEPVTKLLREKDATQNDHRDVTEKNPDR